MCQSSSGLPGCAGLHISERRCPTPAPALWPTAPRVRRRRTASRTRSARRRAVQTSTRMRFPFLVGFTPAPSTSAAGLCTVAGTGRSSVRRLAVHRQLGDHATNFAGQEGFFDHGLAALGTNSRNAEASVSPVTKMTRPACPGQRRSIS